MRLKFRITQEEFDALDEAKQALYMKNGEGYQLDVDGIDPADELKEALRKEREERAEAKRKLEEMEREREELERQRMEEKEDYKTLFTKEQEKRQALERKLTELTESQKKAKRETVAQRVAVMLSKSDATRQKLAKKEAMQYITCNDEGQTAINGVDGGKLDENGLCELLKTEYPFLADGNQSAGSGASGGEGGSGAAKKLKDMSERERLELKRKDPVKFKQLLKQQR